MRVRHKITGFTGCILLLPLLMQAQRDCAQPVISDAFRLQYDYYTKDVVSQPLSPVRSYGYVEGGYRMEGGEYRLAQSPMRQRDLFFTTEGSKQVKKFLASGSFSY